MNPNYKISQLNEFTYSLKIYGDAVNPMYKTIKQLVKTVQYDMETNSIFFSAEKVIS